MRQEAKILLEVIRTSNRKHVILSPEVHVILQEVLAITDQERDEIFDIIAADLREKNASYPGFHQVSAEIERIRAKRNE